MIGVTAVVLTFDARENINRCIAAINAQTLKPRSILVVENPSTAVLPDLTRLTDIPLTVLALGETPVQPAGSPRALLPSLPATSGCSTMTYSQRRSVSPHRCVRWTQPGDAQSCSR